MAELTTGILCMYFSYWVTVGENIIATIKMRKYFWCPLKMVIFLNCSPFSYRFSNFAIAKVVALNIFALTFV